MKTLNILRSEPTPMTRLFIEETSGKEKGEPFLLYQKDIDYDYMVREIFSSDRVICWW